MSDMPLAGQMASVLAPSACISAYWHDTHTLMHYRRTGVVGALVGISVGSSVRPKVGDCVGKAEGKGVGGADEGAGVGAELGDLDASIY